MPTTMVVTSSSLIGRIRAVMPDDSASLLVTSVRLAPSRSSPVR